MSEIKLLPPGELWLDDQGVFINAHGGGILKHDGVFYWYGEHKIAGEAGNRAQVGVHCYSSKDLLHWQDEGIVLAVSDSSDSDIAKGCILERPKVIYNAATDKFVMWFHLEPLGQGYSAASSGVAVGESPTGPFEYLKRYRPNAGYWPLKVRPEQQDLVAIEEARGKELSNGKNDETPQHNILGLDFAEGQQARDMTLFQDDDGTAYHIYSSEHNSTLHIAKLTDDYLDYSGEYVRVFENRWMEAPAVFKRKGKYYLIASGCTGWAPNAARSAIADTMFGPWTEHGNPCVGVNPQNDMGPELTFGGQSTYVLPVDENHDQYVAMFDIWRPKDAIDGRYVWLPITFTDDGFQVTWQD